MKKNQLIKYCNLIVGAISVYGLFIAYKLFMAGFNIGAQVGVSDKTGHPVPSDILWSLISQALLVFGVFASCLLLIFLVVNVRKGMVFVSENARLLMTYGIVVSILGGLSFITSYFQSNSILISGLLTLFGLCFIFISIIFKIGIQLQEEQDLTI